MLPSSAMATVEEFSSTIVALGDFNPPIFSPDWLERNGLIGEEDAATARKDDSLVVTKQLTRFQTDWFILEVIEQRFSLTGRGPLAASPTLKDLAAGIFLLVPHTPIRAVGLNFFAHYKFLIEADYHKVGDVLAPKTVWNKVVAPEGDKDIGLLNLTMQILPSKRGERPTTKDLRQVGVQRSPKVTNGILLSYNDHHEAAFDSDKDKASAESAVEVIYEHWEAAWSDATRIFDELIALSLASEPN